MRKWRWEQANKQKVYFEPVLYTAKIIPIHILLCLNMSIYVIKVKVLNLQIWYFKESEKLAFLFYNFDPTVVHKIVLIKNMGSLSPF